MRKKSSKAGKLPRPPANVEAQAFLFDAIRALPEETFDMLRASRTQQAVIISTNTHTAVLYPATIDGLECIYGLDIHGSGNSLGLKSVIRSIVLLCRANNRAFAFRATHKKWKRLFERNGGVVIRQDEDFIVVFPPVYKGNG